MSTPRKTLCSVLLLLAFSWVGRSAQATEPYDCVRPLAWLSAAGPLDTSQIHCKGSLNLMSGDHVVLGGRANISLRTDDSSGAQQIVACSNEGRAALSIEVVAEPFRLLPAETECGSWQEGEISCSIEGDVVFSCSRFARRKEGAVTSQRRISGVVARAEGDERLSLRESLEDPRIIQWAQLQVRGEMKQLLTSVEEDIVLPELHTHPLAVDIWVRTQQGAGSLEKALLEADSDLFLAVRDRAQLSLNAPAWLDAFSWQKVAEIDQEGLAFVLANTARALGRRVLAEESLLQLTQIAPASMAGPACLGSLWSNDPGAEDAGPPDPSDDLDPLLREVLKASTQPLLRPRLKATDAWLTAHPTDAFAHAHRGQLLVRMGKRVAASKSFAEANRLYPFVRWDQPESGKLLCAD